MTDTLTKIKDWFEYSVSSTAYNEWRRQSHVWYSFYDGNQWTAEELRTLEDRKQPPITINEISGKVDSISGNEIANRTNVTFRPRTFDEQDRVMSEAFTAIAMQWQDRTNAVYEYSDVFKNDLIGGIGWINLYRDADAKFRLFSIDPYEMVWDVDDKSPFMVNQRFVCRMKWFDREELSMSFEDKKEEIEALMGSNTGMLNSRTSFGEDTANGSAITSYTNDNADKLLVIEVQWREAAVAYEYIDQNKRKKRTFDKKQAESNKFEDTKVKPVGSYKIKQAFYTCDLLLQDEKELETQDEMFEYIPMVHKKDKITNMPYGIVKNAIDPQREVNKRRSKALHLLNSNQVLIDGDNIDVEDIEVIRKEASSPNGVMIGNGIKINNNTALAAGQAEMYHQAKAEIQSTMGVYDENLGAQTNATSGVAIQSRQMASLGTQSTIFNSFKRFKKVVGLKMLGLIQSIGDDEIVVDLLDTEEGEALGFVMTGKQVMLNKKGENDVIEYDVSTAEFDIYITEDVAYEAPPAEVADAVTKIIMNGQGQLLQMPSLLKLLGIRNTKQFAQEASRIPQPSPDGQGGETQITSVNGEQSLPQ